MGLVALLALVAGCANQTARVVRVIGSGPIALDRDRPVHVGSKTGNQFPISIPLAVMDSVPGMISSCSVRGRWVSPEQRDAIATLPDSAALGWIPPFGPGDAVSVPQPLVVSPRGLPDRRAPDRRTLVTGSPTILTPIEVLGTPIDSLPLRNPVGDLTWSIFFQTWVAEGPSGSDSCPPQVIVSDTTYFLVDVETTRPIAGGAIGSGALILAFVALTSIIAVGVGG